MGFSGHAIVENIREGKNTHAGASPSIRNFHAQDEGAGISQVRQRWCFGGFVEFVPVYGWTYAPSMEGGFVGSDDGACLLKMNCGRIWGRGFPGAAQDKADPNDDRRRYQWSGEQVICRFRLRRVARPIMGRLCIFVWWRRN
jgi:hypothetical protein